MKNSIYIVEEHNEAFYIWLKAFNEGLISANNTLLHFDEHADFRYPVLKNSINKVVRADESFIQKFARTELHIDSFIVPAIYLGIINEFYWIRQDIHKTDVSEHFLRTYNNEGKYFISGKKTSVTGQQTGNSFTYVKTGAEELSKLKIDPAKPVLLDIDLDYFSCCENPYIQNEIVIEITEQEYNDFINNPYHYLHFVTAHAEVMKYNGSFFYVLNNVPEKYQSKREVTESEIIKRIGVFVNDISSMGVVPAVVSICRSRYSGFTPFHQWEFIEKQLLSALKLLFDFEVVHINSLYNKNASLLPNAQPGPKTLRFAANL